MKPLSVTCVVIRQIWKFSISWIDKYWINDSWIHESSPLTHNWPPTRIKIWTRKLRKLNLFYLIALIKYPFSGPPVFLLNSTYWYTILFMFFKISFSIISNVALSLFSAETIFYIFETHQTNSITHIDLYNMCICMNVHLYTCKIIYIWWGLTQSLWF